MKYNYLLLLCLPLFVSSYSYDSHRPLLIAAVEKTDGPVLELGCGWGSTPVLHALCVKNNRFLLSTDTSKVWLEKFYHLKRPWHQFLYVPVYDDDWEKNPKPWKWDVVGEDKYWGVVLVDHRPGERRKADIWRLRNSADILIVHDSETAGYEYDKVFSTFKYQFTYKKINAWTTALSNVVDVTKLLDE